jgi:uncharacterized damage-inducible protein DinB
MANNDLIADVIARTENMVRMTLEDMSDAELMTRPCPSANHPNWQLGHMIASEAGMVDMIKPGACAVLPEGFAEKYHRDKAKIDDPAAFENKARLLEVHSAVRAATLKFVKELSAEDMSKPGPERMRRMCPTVGHVVHLLPQHVSMHLGQIQVMRRKLGKPVLF